MLKFFAGVTAGILGTVLVLHFYDGAGNGTKPPGPIAGNATNSAEPASAPPITARGPDLAEQQPARHSTNHAAQGISALVDNKTPAGASELAPSVTAQTQAQTSADLPVEPVPFPEKHRKLIERTQPRPPPVGTPELHQRLESEPRDLSWSYYIEEQLKNYLYSTAVPKGIEIIAIECRSTLCEIQGLTHADTAGQWMIVLEGMQKEPWWIEFGGVSIGSSEVDNETLMLTFLTRKKKE